jgi:hypothetical protein
MPRFDAYRNPNPRAEHGMFLDIQSDLVRTSTRWCMPLLRDSDNFKALSRVHLRLQIGGEPWWLDGPNILAVPSSLLRTPVASLAPDDRLRVEGAIDFMLHGY